MERIREAQDQIKEENIWDRIGFIEYRKKRRSNNKTNYKDSSTARRKETREIWKSKQYANFLNVYDKLLTGLKRP